ncbi:MAG: UbiA prenyltransferase family protein [Fimbriimonas sp.]
MRPKQWTKNLLVFAALIFSGLFREPASILAACAAFAGMCLVSSATYVFNDLADANRDRHHPTKRFRPIASGAIGKVPASALGTLLLAVGLALVGWLGASSLSIVGVYLALQVLYNLWLKRVPVADVHCIAAGFVLRAVLGAAAIGVSISGWLLFCTGALALMLGFGKRRHEFLLQGELRSHSRESLVSYNRVVLDALVLMFATAAALCYGIYSLESTTASRFPGIIVTTPLVVYGIARYLLIVFTIDEGGEPADVLFKDPHLLLTIFLFLVTSLAAMSGLRLPLIER